MKLSDNSLNNFKRVQLLLMELKTCVKCTRYAFQVEHTDQSSLAACGGSVWTMLPLLVAQGWGGAAADDSRTMCLYERCAVTVCRQRLAA